MYTCARATEIDSNQLGLGSIAGVTIFFGVWDLVRCWWILSNGKCLKYFEYTDTIDCVSKVSFFFVFCSVSVALQITKRCTKLAKTKCIESKYEMPGKILLSNRFGKYLYALDRNCIIPCIDCDISFYISVRPFLTGCFPALNRPMQWISFSFRF